MKTPRTNQALKADDYPLSLVTLCAELETKLDRFAETTDALVDAHAEKKDLVHAEEIDALVDTIQLLLIAMQSAQPGDTPWKQAVERGEKALTKHIPAPAQ